MPSPFGELKKLFLLLQLGELNYSLFRKFSSCFQIVWIIGFELFPLLKDSIFNSIIPSFRSLLMVFRETFSGCLQKSVEFFKLPFYTVLWT